MSRWGGATKPAWSREYAGEFAELYPDIVEWYLEEVAALR